MKTKMDWELIFIILSALLTAGLGVNAHIKSNSKDLELRENQRKLENSQNQLIGKQNELNNLQDLYGKSLSEKSDSILSLANKLEEANSQIITLSKELQNQVSGDKTVPKLYAAILQDENKIKFFLSNSSHYPIPDVFVQVSDMNKIIDQEKKELTFKAPNDESASNISIGTLSPLEKRRPFYKTELPSRFSSYQYMFFVRWRGGSCTAWVEIEKHNKEFKVVRYAYLGEDGKRKTELPLH